MNIGNPHEVTIEEIARTIIRLVGSTSQIVYAPLPVDDPKQRRPDITRARTLLGWEPKVGLEEGLLKTVDYFTPGDRARLGRSPAYGVGASLTSFAELQHSSRQLESSVSASDSQTEQVDHDRRLVAGS